MNIGLVLSGGMAKGAYQIGALQALNEFIPQGAVQYMSCASIGVLNGYAYATQNLKRAEQMWAEVCADNARLLISQILRSSMLQHNIADIYDPGKRLSATFYASLLDISHRSLTYKDLSAVEPETVLPYLKASVAMPIYNRAVRIANVSYFDGAMVDNIPVYPLLQHQLDYLICIYFDDTCYKFESTCFDNKIIKITFPCESMLRQSLVFKQTGIQQMLQTGYDKTASLLSCVFSKGYDNLEHIYSTIALLNQNKTGSLRITGDVITTNFNKITQKLTKKRIL